MFSSVAQPGEVEGDEAPSSAKSIKKCNPNMQGFNFKCAGDDQIEHYNFSKCSSNLSNLADPNCLKNVQNGIQMALKWLFFF